MSKYQQKKHRITRSLPLKNDDTLVSNQIITLLENILQQNYFAFQNKLYQPEKVIKGI